ncbi:MAG: NUDIX domain-containing protein [Acidimicrobiia bacterium]|nr:NUDIX domain-containing protein [Acidimicrobiia bacterium]
MSSREELQFLSDYEPADYERPSVAVDVVLLTQVESEMRVFVVRRTEHPHKGTWTLPGSFVRPDESLDAAATRVVEASMGISDVYLEQLYSFGSPNRDPRTRVISVAYYALASWERVRRINDTEGTALARIDVPWQGEQGGPVRLVVDDVTARVGFDHDGIIGMAIKRVRGKLDYAPIGYQLLPRDFSLLQLQQVHETIAGHSLNKDSFRRRMLASNELEATGERQDGVGHRPAALYRFTRRSAI